MMSPLLTLSLVLIGCFVFAIPLHWFLLGNYCPRKYRQLKDSGRFANMPDTWEELWVLWTAPQDELESEMVFRERRVSYGQFVDKFLMPVPHLRNISTFAGVIGFVLLLIHVAIALLS